MNDDPFSFILFLFFMSFKMVKEIAIEIPENVNGILNVLKYPNNILLERIVQLGEQQTFNYGTNGQVSSSPKNW